MADQVTIPTTGLWSTIANTLNQMFTTIFGRTGWATYAGSTYNSGNKLVVSAGTTVLLPNNAASGLSIQKPLDITTFYDGVRLQGQNSGDYYLIRITFIAHGSVNDSGFNIMIDISAAGDGSNVIASKPTRMIKGSGAGNAQPYTVEFQYFTLNTFVANGGLLKIEAVDGDISIYDITYLNARTHKAR